MPDPTSSITPRARRRWPLALAALLLATGAGAAWLLRDPTPRILERRSRLTSAVVESREIVDGHLIETVRLTAASGMRVALTLKRPPDTLAARARPLVVLLGGHRTGRDAATLLPPTRNAVVAALAYPYDGDHRIKGLAVVRAAPAIRGAILDTPAAIMLALDWLLAAPDVDTTRVDGVGVSLGVPFMTIAGALDARIGRVWAIHGGAGSYAPMEHNLRRSIPFAPARAAVAGLGTLIISGPRLQPDRWAGRIAPRPFVMVNAEADEKMPRALAERLHASAREPKEQIWLPGNHVRARAEVVRGLAELVVERVSGD